MDSRLPPAPEPESRASGPSSPASPAPAGGSTGAHSRQTLRQAPPQVPDMEHFAALLNRQLGFCRRSGSRMALLLLQGELATAPLQRPWEPRQAELLWPLVGARLANGVRGTDVVCRIGESRFAAVLMGAGRTEAEIVRKRLLKVLTGPYAVEHQTLGLALQTGTSVFRECGHTGSELTAAAERALRGPGRARPGGGQGG